MASDEQVAMAIKAAITAQMRDGVEVYDHDEHQGLDVAHVQYGQARRYVAAERSGQESVAAFRVDTRVVDVSVSNVRATQRRVDLALSGAQVAVEGRRTSPIRRESQDDAQPDEGLYSALTTWTFTL